MRRMIPVLILALFLLSSCTSIGPVNRVVQRDNPYNRINHTKSTETYRFSYYAEEIGIGDPKGFFAGYQDLKEGDSFILGKYDGRPIAWVVLSASNGHVTAVASRPLFERLFVFCGYEFEGSSLYNMLNGKFLNECFSAYERELIGNHVSIPSVGQSRRMRQLYFDSNKRFHGWVETYYWYAVDDDGCIVQEGISGRNIYNYYHSDDVIPAITLTLYLNHERQFIY